LQYKKRQMNRTMRQRFFAATAFLSLALWLFLAAAEIHQPLHAWLHGGSIPDNDDCAIVAIAHGKVDSAACDVPIVTPTAWFEAAPTINFFAFSTAIENLPSGRAPPAVSSPQV